MERTSPGDSSDATVAPELVGVLLGERGWHQGSIVSVQRMLDMNIIQSDLATHCAVRSEAVLVMLSQDCDIVRSVEHEPIVEMVQCNRDPERTMPAVSNSSRYFQVDPQSHLIANATERVQVRKQVLLAIEPDPFIWDPQRLKYFARWAGSRFDRAAFPDEFNTHVASTIKKRLSKLKKADPAVWYAIDRYVHEFRAAVRSVAAAAPRLACQLIAVMRTTIPSDQVHHVKSFLESIQSDVNSSSNSPISVDATFAQTIDRLPMSVVLDFDPLDLEYLSVAGLEIGETLGRL